MTATATTTKPNGRPPMTASERARLAATVAATRAEQGVGDPQPTPARIGPAPAASPKPTKPKTPKKKADAPAKPHGPQGPAYTNRVVCCHKVNGKVCGAIRWTKPQDKFQVKRCVEHTAVYKKERAKARRAAAAKAAKTK